MSLAAMPNNEPEVELDLTGSVQVVLRIEREKQDVTWKEVAKTSGVPYNTLLRYVHDAKDIPLRALERIAPALGKDASEIIRLAESGEISLRAEWELDLTESHPVVQLRLETPACRPFRERSHLVPVS